MPKPEWFFKKHETGEHIVAHINAEFFKTDHIDNLPSAFVRETIQNSLDAKNDKYDSVKVRFRIGTMSRKHFDTSLFDQLSKHINAQGSGISNESVSLFNRNFNFIVCEDFNTKGLCGDVSYAKSAIPQEENDFYFFFRNDGRSGKKSSLGKWGVGKTIYPAISHINMFWAITVRITDNKEYLMGRAILGHHTIKNVDYTPWGYYGIRNKLDSILILPDDDSDRINHFKKIFKLERDKKPGLSIVVPFISDDFTPEAIIHACISQYLYPIANGHLEISVSYKLKTWDINSDSVEEIIKEYSKEGKEDIYNRLRNTLNFIRYINKLSKGDYIPLRKSSLNQVPKWSSTKLFDKETLHSCMKSFERGENLNFIVPIQIHFKNGEKRWGKFRLHIQRDHELAVSEDMYIRNGLRIPGVSSIGGRKLRGIFIADQSPLSDLLCTAENPAHTEWQVDAEGFKDKYDHAEYTLNFVKNAFSRIISILTKPLENSDVDLLAEWFPFEISKNSMKQNSRTTKKKGRKREIPNPPSELYTPIATIQKTSSGFTVKSNPKYNGQLDTIEIIAAYHTTRGNPLKRYSPFDFNFKEKGTITIEKRGLKSLEIGNNRLVFEILDDNFNVTVNGFDENRDVYVKLVKLSP